MPSSPCDTRFATDNSFLSRFGNFIGEEADASEDESQHGVDAGNYVYDDEYAEGEQGAAGQELMEVDGTLPSRGATRVPTRLADLHRRRCSIERRRTPRR